MILFLIIIACVIHLNEIHSSQPYIQPHDMICICYGDDLAQYAQQSLRALVPKTIHLQRDEQNGGINYYRVQVNQLNEHISQMYNKFMPISSSNQDVRIIVLKAALAFTGVVLILQNGWDLLNVNDKNNKVPSSIGYFTVGMLCILYPLVENTVISALCPKKNTN